MITRKQAVSSGLEKSCDLKSYLTQGKNTSNQADTRAERQKEATNEKIVEVIHSYIKTL
jgi:hypothetical protein